MKTMYFLAAAAIAAFSFGDTASAATYTSTLSCDEIADIDPDADDCFGTTVENANAQQVNLNGDTFIEGAVSTTGLFGYQDWTTFESEPNFGGGPTGSFTVGSNNYGMVAILLKSANTFAAYIFENGFEGDVDYFTANDRGLSNYVVAGRDVSAVPLPAAGWMLLAGVGGFAAMRRRKKS